MTKPWKGSGFIILTLILLSILILSMAMGSESIPLSHTIKLVLSKIPVLGDAVDVSDISSAHEHILWQLRLPRILGALLIGMGLSCSGLIFQSTLQNPLADPYILGVSSGAAVGATLSILLPGAFFSTALFAFVGALVTIVMVYVIASRLGSLRSTTLILTGIAASLFLSAMVSFLISVNHQLLDRIVFWTMGSVSTVSYGQLKIITIPIMLGIGCFIFFAKDLNLFSLGEEVAMTTGSDVRSIRKILLFVASMVCAMAVSVSGVIGFVGLVVPHAIRLVFGNNHYRVIPATLLAGGAFLILCDLISRTLIAPTQIPLGVVTALLGSPYFIYLLLRQGARL